MAEVLVRDPKEYIVYLLRFLGNTHQASTILATVHVIHTLVCMPDISKQVNEAAKELPDLLY